MKPALPLVLLAVAAPAAAFEPGTLEIGGTEYTVEWHRPTAAPSALAVIEHGFTRRCSRLRGTLEAVAGAGLLVLCIDAPMAGGNPALADALAARLAGPGLIGPDGQPVPERIIVGGHSAGGAFAVRLGWQLALQAPDRLAGALLFDAVAVSGFEAQVRALAGQGQRPVLAISANGGPCNARNNTYPGLRAVAADDRSAGGDGFVGVELARRSTHVDAEGGDSDTLGWLACGQGRPRATNVGWLRALAATWAGDMARGTRDPAWYPGGEVLEGLVGRGSAIPIGQEGLSAR